MWGGKNFPRDVIFNGSNQRGFATGGLQYGFDEERSRALSVGSGDSRVRNSLGRTLIEIRAEAGEGAASMHDLRPGNRGARRFGRRIGDYGSRSGSDSLIDKPIAVASLTLDRDKD